MEAQQETFPVTSGAGVANHQIVSREKWIEARKELLKREKELSRLQDQLSAQRRELPWVKVEKNYTFDDVTGKVTLADLFEHRSQLYIYHFMFDPDWEEGCKGCSFMADHIDGPNLHLAHHDVSVVVVSRAPLEKLLAFKKRMGWQFRWVSSFESDFNYDYHVSFTDEQIASGQVYYNYEYAHHDDGHESPGSSTFYKDPSGNIFHTYSTYARGGDILIGTHNFLDMMPKGRNEEEIMDWMRLHDQYDDFKGGGSCCH